MSRRLPARLALALVVAAVAAVLAPGQALAALSLSLSRDVRFPERAYVVTLPEQTRLATGQVQVSEDGAPVRQLRVAPVGAARQAKLGVVLAIDASGSMAGEPFAQAIDAAGAFVAERNPRQPLAAITFGTGSRVLLPFTDREDLIDAALANPGTPAGGTDMHDAALRSIQLIESSKLRGGFVVVLSDGTDHGSTATTEDVLAAADRANVKIYTVGLRSDRFDPETLGQLAQGSGGEYSEATSADELSGIYSALGAQFSNAHVISYRSTVGPQRDVRVKVVVENLGAVMTTYRSPRLKLDAPAASDGDGLGSDAAPILAVIIVVGLLATALLIVLRGPRQTPSDRVARFVGSNGNEPDGHLTVRSRLAHGAERSLRDASWWEGFATDIDVAGISRSPGQIVVTSFIGALVLAFLVTSISGIALLGLLPLLLTPFVVRAVIHVKADRKRRLFGDQLADHLAVVGGSLRVGHSLPAALSAALDEAPEPARREFERVVADESLGMPLEDALGNVSRRMDSREVEHVALLARLQREVGSDAAEMVDQVVATVRERQELRRTIRTMTAQGRFAQLILSVLPVVALTLLTLTNRPYVEPLYTTPGGNIVLVIAALLVVAGSLVIRKIITIKT
jgi:tight adherence protein B